ILRIHNDGLGLLNGANVNLTRGYPVFNDNNQDDDATPFGQLAVFGCFAAPATPCSCVAGLVACNVGGTCPGGGNNCGIVSNGRQGRSRAADRSCMFESLPAANVNLPDRQTRLQGPPDDDCDNDIVSLGVDGAPGVAGVDDDGDGVIDNPEEACPCFTGQDAIDDDADGRRDEGDERQRFYRCSGVGNPRCVVTGVNTDNCGAIGSTGPCGRFGDGKPLPYGDDVCGDGSIDEGVSAKWAAETAL